MHTHTNACIRCGKERIVTKTWEEKVETFAGISLVKHAQYVCPDTICQAKVDKSLAEQRQVALERQQQAEKREQERALSRQRMRKLSTA